MLPFFRLTILLTSTSFSESSSDSESLYTSESLLSPALALNTGALAVGTGSVIRAGGGRDTFFNGLLRGFAAPVRRRLGGSVIFCFIIHTNGGIGSNGRRLLGLDAGCMGTNFRGVCVLHVDTRGERLRGFAVEGGCTGRCGGCSIERDGLVLARVKLHP